MQTDPRPASAASQLPRARPDGETLPTRLIPSAGFDATVLSLGRWSLVWVRGELDLGTATVFAARLEPLAMSRTQRVVIDLSDLTFVDCAGIRVFLRARTLLRAAGGDLFVRAPSRMFVRMLEILGVTDLLLDGPAPSRSRHDDAA